MNNLKVILIKGYSASILTFQTNERTNGNGRERKQNAN